MAVALLAATMGAGCNPERPTNQDFCDEVAIAAAQRSFDCVEETDAANAAHDDVDRLTCRAGGDEATSVTSGALLPCTDLILATDCAVVKAHPREPVQHWMPATCGALLDGITGAAGTTGGSF